MKESPEISGSVLIQGLKVGPSNVLRMPEGTLYSVIHGEDAICDGKILLLSRVAPPALLAYRDRKRKKGKTSRRYNDPSRPLKGHQILDWVGKSPKPLSLSRYAETTGRDVVAILLGAEKKKVPVNAVHWLYLSKHGFTLRANRANIKEDFVYVGIFKGEDLVGCLASYPENEVAWPGEEREQKQ